MRDRCPKCSVRQWRDGASLSCARSGVIDSQSWINQVVKKIDDEIDDHENQRNEAKVCGHDGDVRRVYGLNEQQAHTRPLKDGLRDDGECNDAAKLQANDSDN